MIYATTSDQVLMALLYALRNADRHFRVQDMQQYVCEFQQCTGTIIYGSHRRPWDRESITQDIEADVADLRSRALMTCPDNPDELELTIIALPVASSFKLSPPLDRLRRFVCGELLSSTVDKKKEDDDGV